ncbi:MAG: hypothetical protein AKCLJLPJ_01424 [Fimbriimonadales bacterium]|nr:MAG: hypothetical protein EDM73_07005 [Armatimonadota bacterium]MBV6503354.1 hypothetical protein [Fimbriimonadales bacterium]MCE7899852.1 hypothetical protein [Armatimonadetes bacterium ATM1]MDL1928694.1 hypothetical protein [Fimbriimonadia bacterium ATM]MBC6968723.1 hypothetical protein [Armatimonadota bacterium]
MFATLAAFAATSFAPASPAESAAWQRYSLGTSGLTMELPAAPSRFDLPLSNDVRGKVEVQEAYMVSSSFPVLIASYTRYMQGIQVNLASAADGAVGSLKSRAKPGTFTLKQSDTEACGYPAKAASGSFDSGQGKFRFTLLAFGAGRDFWQTIALWPEGSDGGSAAQRALSSVQMSR